MIPKARLFDEQYARLTAIAYRMLGSVSDSEDVVQEAWLRFSRVTLDLVDNVEAYLAAMVSRLCIDRLRRRRIEKLNYTGYWLPEPVPTEDSPADAIDVVESVSMALMVVLEHLNPMERAVFILKEAFDYAHEDIAVLLGINVAHSRQLLRRAKSRIGVPERAPGRDELEPLVTAFFEAARSGDTVTLSRVLADDCIAYSDGGGRASAALIPLVGRDRVITVFSHLLRKAGNVRLEWRRVNNEWAVCAIEQGAVTSVTTFEVRDGKVWRSYTIRNPDKLARFRAGA